jgi:2-amino-4-hydroxy-6-hydroxymethyldihydropteridine diphosphokinase
VIRIATDWPPDEILLLLHDLERQAGRVRRRRWEARILDLDLLAHGSRVMAGPSGPRLPHPRLGERAFVLRPLSEIATAWRHPGNHMSAQEMLEKLPAGQRLLRLP